MSYARTTEQLLIEQVDRWLNHVRTCQVEDCADCEARFNQVNLAHNIWMRNKEIKSIMRAE